MNPFTINVKKLILQIPAGRVATYGQIAAQAGNPRAARQVARILHACARKDSLPWHRVVNQHGRISLRHSQGYEIQQTLLELEGVVFTENNRIDLSRFIWNP
ncbi:MAG: DNA methyltransferase [Desulfobacterium sp.]|nr:DNA methyltransferase [Desulfobacterium sp.]